MKRNLKEEIEILRHQKRFLEIDLEKAKRFGDECKRQKNEWCQVAQKLAEVVLNRSVFLGKQRG